MPSSIGDDTSDADAEIIAMTIDSLKSAGLRDFQVDIGQVEFFNGLVEEAGLSTETEEQLRELIEEKNFFGVEELVSEQKLPKALSDLFLKLPDLFGPVEVIETARSMTDNPRCLAAIRRLENLYRILGYYGLSDYVSFDLGMLGKYKYYTGIIFRGVTFGMGEPIVSGGRYDGLMRQFGKDAPSVGFSISIDGLLAALSRQKIQVDIPKTDAVLLYEKEEQQSAIAHARALREEGTNLQMIRRGDQRPLSEYLAYRDRNDITILYYLKEGTLYRYEPGSDDTDDEEAE